VRVSDAEEPGERCVLTHTFFAMVLGSPGFTLGPRDRPGDEASELGRLVKPPRGLSRSPAVRVWELDDSAGLSPWATNLLPASSGPAYSSLHFTPGRERRILVSTGDDHQHIFSLSIISLPKTLTGNSGFAHPLGLVAPQLVHRYCPPVDVNHVTRRAHHAAIDAARKCMVLELALDVLGVEAPFPESVPELLLAAQCRFREPRRENRPDEQHTSPEIRVRWPEWP
jgi:hypothetical protein